MLSGWTSCLTEIPSLRLTGRRGIEAPAGREQSDRQARPALRTPVRSSSRGPAAAALPCVTQAMRGAESIPTAASAALDGWQ